LEGTEPIAYRVAVEHLETWLALLLEEAFNQKALKEEVVENVGVPEEI
jgi:hypothetical protein